MQLDLCLDLCLFLLYYELKKQKWLCILYVEYDVIPERQISLHVEGRKTVHDMLGTGT